MVRGGFIFMKRAKIKLKLYIICYFSMLKYGIINLQVIGERSQVVKALGCGSSIRGFDSRRSPFTNQSLEKHLSISQLLLLRLRFYLVP